MSYTFNKNVDIRNPVSLFDEVNTVSRTPIFEIVPTKGTSAIRDITTIVGSAGITTASAELHMTTGTTAGSSIENRSAARGRYMSGFGGQIGIGFRLDSSTASAISGTADVKWGYFTDDDGFGFGKDSGGLYTFVLRDGVQTDKTYSTSWNFDTLDGNGPSGLTWNGLRGNIYHINFSWYGYGGIFFVIIDIDPITKQQREFLVHQYRPDSDTSVEYPNLPINVKVDNGDQSTNLGVFVGGRQFSVIGPFNPDNRIVSEYMFNKGTDTTMRPIISFQSKNTREDLAIAKKIEGFDTIVSSQNVMLELRVGGTVSNTASFQVPSGHSNNEVTVLSDTTANTITGGTVLWYGLIDASGTGSNSSGSREKDGIGVTIPENSIVTISARTITGTGTISSVLRIREEW